MTDPTLQSPEEVSTFLATVGLEVFKIAAMCNALGWETPQGAVPYMHLEKPSPAWDLVLWAIGRDKAAKERMHAIGAEWAPLVTLDTDPFLPEGLRASIKDGAA